MDKPLNVCAPEMPSHYQQQAAELEAMAERDGSQRAKNAMRAAARDIRELESALAAMTADRDMWLQDDVKQNNALGRCVAELEAARSTTSALAFPAEPALGVMALMMSEFGLTRDQARTYYNTMRALTASATPDGARAAPDPCSALCRECKGDGICIKQNPVYKDFAKSVAP